MLRLPEQADRRLQQLMDRNNEGLLTEQERADLEALAELSEQLSLVRAEALHLLGRSSWLPRASLQADSYSKDVVGSCSKRIKIEFIKLADWSLAKWRSF